MDVTLSVEPSASTPALPPRPWRIPDLPALVAAHRDLTLRWANAKLTTSIKDEADAHRWLAAQDYGWATGTRFSFAVLEVGSGTADADFPIGTVAVKGIARGQVSAQVGYWTSAQARGRGIAPRSRRYLAVGFRHPARDAAGTPPPLPQKG
jgi:RimJ/RimL family protein N-acetyltransferase